MKADDVISSVPPEVGTPPESMGHVTAPTGSLLVIDPGMLNLWSHDRPVVAEPSRLITDEVVRTANGAIDIRIEGPDAARVGRLYDRQWHPLFLYDIPATAVEKTVAAIDSLVRDHRLVARAIPLPKRVRHRDRIAETIRWSPVGGEVQYHGMWSVVATGLPTDRRLPVVGQRMPDEENGTRWRHVFVELSPEPPACSELLGRVMVDEAKLLFADVDGLGQWEQQGVLDGLADYVFWGRDAEAVARQVSAPRLDANNWGWVNFAPQALRPLALAVEAIHDAGTLKFAVDFRPHTDFYRLLEQVRRTSTASGTVPVGGADLCGFHTSWGDGLFPVYLDRAADESPVRVRVDLGHAQTVQTSRAMHERFFGEFAKFAAVSLRVAREGLPVRRLYRMAPMNDRDSGWCVFAGDENQDCNDESANIARMPLRDLIDRDRSLEPIFRTPAPAAFERGAAGQAFRPVDPPLGR